MFSAYDSAGNPVTLPASPANTGTKISKRFIPIAQGFMVEGASNAPVGSNVYLKNAHRVYEKISDGDSVFFRNATDQASNNEVNENIYDTYGLNIVPEDYKRFRLNVTFNDQYTRQLLQNFHYTATSDFDYGLEAKSPSNASTDAHWVTENTPYTIQANAFAEDLTIPLVINTDVAQPLKFSIFDIQNFDENQAIYLHDTANDTFVDLTIQDYEINIEAGNYASRFEIVFQNDNALSVRDLTMDQFNIIVNNDESLFVISNPDRLKLAALDVFDINGRLIFNHAISSVDEVYNHTSKFLSNGFYIARVKLEDNRVISKKVIVKHKQ